jgi:endo-1,4-beta-xylanase
LLKLVKGEWWLPTTKFWTDANGQFSFNGFLGEYELSLGNQKIAFALNTKGETAFLVDL